MDRQQLSQLFERYLRNQCSEEEIEILLHYFGETEDNPILKGLVKDALQTTVDEGFEQREDVREAFRQTDRYLESIMAEEHITPTRRLYRYLRYGAAATILLACAFGLYRYQYQAPSPAEQQIQFVDADPGTDKAILTLADGRSIVLDGVGDETLFDDGEITISKTADGQIIYTPHIPVGRTNVYNEMATPRGGQYQIVLPDGSKVWLNAASKLRYPAQFTGDKRMVELEGEAYFEVRGSARGTRVPFIVKTRGQEIEVLGTQFNISAYADGQVTKTTLVEGSVRVALATNHLSPAPGHNPTILKPGQQATSVDGNMRIREVDVENEISWKNGEFTFINMPLVDIMEHLSRWYDVGIANTEIPHTRYTVFISRQVKLSTVLRMLEKTGNLRFALDETNHIVITPKTEQPM